MQPQHPRQRPDTSPGMAWLLCPVCELTVEFEACHTRCPRCRTLIESCSDGGRLPEPT